MIDVWAYECRQQTVQYMDYTCPKLPVNVSWVGFLACMSLAVLHHAFCLTQNSELEKCKAIQRGWPHIRISCPWTFCTWAGYKEELPAPSCSVSKSENLSEQSVMHSLLSDHQLQILQKSTKSKLLHMGLVYLGIQDSFGKGQLWHMPSHWLQTWVA